MSKYTVASEEGAQRYGAEQGAQIDLELTESDERAVICAGWLELAPAKQAKED